MFNKFKALSAVGFYPHWLVLVLLPTGISTSLLNFSYFPMSSAHDKFCPLLTPHVHMFKWLDFDFYRLALIQEAGAGVGERRRLVATVLLSVKNLAGTWNLAGTNSLDFIEQLPFQQYSKVLVAQSVGNQTVAAVSW